MRFGIHAGIPSIMTINCRGGSTSARTRTAVGVTYIDRYIDKAESAEIARYQGKRVGLPTSQL